MDYIKQMNGFMDRIYELNGHDKAIRLYLELFKINNNRKWCEWFTTTNEYLVSLTSLSNVTIIANRNLLKQLGFIDFIVGGKRKPTKYKLIPLNDVIVYSLNDKVNDKVNYNLNDKVNEKLNEKLNAYKDIDINKNKKEKSKKRKFTPPTLEDVKKYVAEKNLSVDALFFFNYYDEGDWHDKKGEPVLNWKQKALTWSKREEGEKCNGKPDGNSERTYTEYEKQLIEADKRQKYPWEV